MLIEIKNVIIYSVLVQPTSFVVASIACVGGGEYEILLILFYLQYLFLAFYFPFLDFLVLIARVLLFYHISSIIWLAMTLSFFYWFLQKLQKASIAYYRVP